MGTLDKDNADDTIDEVSVPREIEKWEKRVGSSPLDSSRKESDKTLESSKKESDKIASSSEETLGSSRKEADTTLESWKMESDRIASSSAETLDSSRKASDATLESQRKDSDKIVPSSPQRECTEKAPTDKLASRDVCSSSEMPKMAGDDPLQKHKVTDKCKTTLSESKQLSAAIADPLRNPSVKSPVRKEIAQTSSQSNAMADPLSALLDQKKNKPVPSNAEGVLGFTPPSRSPWLSAQSNVPPAISPLHTKQAHAVAVASNSVPRTSPLNDNMSKTSLDPVAMVGDPLGALRDQRKVGQVEQRSRSSMGSDLVDVDGVLGRSSESQSPVIAHARAPRVENGKIPTEADLATSLRDFLGDFAGALDTEEATEEPEGEMARAVCDVLPANDTDERWSEQTVEAHEEETLTLGPFGPGQKYEILKAWYGVSQNDSTIDVTHIVQRMQQECKSGSLKITKADLGAMVNSPDALRGVIGWKMISVKYRMKVRDSDVSYGNYREGLGRVGNVVPILTKTLANVVGATLAAGGYAVAKAEMEVKNRLLATRDENGQRVDGTDSELADSEIFQAGFNAWLSLNGIKPSITYEPTGKAGVRLRWLYAESGGCGEMPPEDIKQTPILIANHISYIDALVLTTIFGAPKVIAKSGTLNTPLIGRFAKEIGVIEVDRGSKSSRQATLDAIANHVGSWRPGDRPLLLFPEGTTSNGVDLLEFKKGAFAPGAPVRPIVICYTGKWHPANTNFKMSGGEIKPTNDLEWTEQFLGHFIHSLTVRVLPPYIPSEEEKADPSLFAGNVRCIVADTYSQMRTKAEAEAAEKERTRAPGPLQRVREVIAGH